MKAESHDIEWKLSWDDEYLKWICGFANAQGGRIYLGIDDEGIVVGLPNAKKLLADLPNRIRDKLGLMSQINLLGENGKRYLEIVVEPSSSPVSFRGAYYYRAGSVKHEIRGTALNDFLMRKMGATWDTAIEPRVTLADICEATVKRFKRDALDSQRLDDVHDLTTNELLQKLRLITREGITRAAVVLFGKDPGEFYPNLSVKIGRFVDDSTDLRFQEVCEGNLVQMLRDVMEQLEKKFLIKKIHFEGIHRIEKLEYPVAALREMVLNALVHRNYLGSGTLLRVNNDSLSLWNAGLLPEELSIEKLLQIHASVPRNPLIADVCYKAGYIDSWGRGVEKITKSCRELDLPAPRFSESTGGLLVELRRVNGNGASNTREVILSLIKENPKISTKNLAETLGANRSGIDKHLKQLREGGAIIRIGGTRGYWKITAE